MEGIFGGGIILIFVIMIVPLLIAIELMFTNLNVSRIVKRLDKTNELLSKAIGSKKE